ncbi:MAG: TonB-dependent receptor [bacterium]
MSAVKHIACALLLLPLILMSQQKDTTKIGKPIPDVRRFEVTPPNPDLQFLNAQREKQSTDLPKIDLPEFVITGTAMMELPEVQKLDVDELGAFQLTVAPAKIGLRDRTTLEFVREQKLGYSPPIHSPFFGRVLVSGATHFTPEIDFSFGQSSPEGYFLSHANYYSTKGYVPSSNRSKGAVDLSGGTTLESPSSWLNQNMLHATFGLSSETYQFFGSTSPSLARSVTAISLGTSLTSSPAEAWSYQYAMDYSNLTMKDSSQKTTENRVDLLLVSSVPGSFIPLTGKVRFNGVTYSGGNSGSLPYLDIELSTKRLWWKNLFMQASGHLYLAKGMMDQKVSRVYPHLYLGARIIEGFTLSTSYRGIISFSSFHDYLQVQPYLGSSSLLLFSDISTEISGGIEGHLGSWLDVKFDTRYQSIRNQPILSNPGNQGVWSFSYGGKTTWITYSTDIIAKLSPNVYFALAIDANETKNSILDHPLPYVANVLASTRLVYGFENGLSISPQFDYIGKRSIDTFTDRSLPGYLLTGIAVQYAFHRSWNAMIDFQNLFDNKFDEWQGYRGTPFMMRIGVEFKW